MCCSIENALYKFITIIVSLHACDLSLLKYLQLQTKLLPSLSCFLVSPMYLPAPFDVVLFNIVAILKVDLE